MTSSVISTLKINLLYSIHMGFDLMKCTPLNTKPLGVEYLFPFGVGVDEGSSVST